MNLPTKIAVSTLLAGVLPLLASCAPAPEPGPPPAAPAPHDAPPPAGQPADPQAVPLADLGSDLEYRVELDVESEDRGGTAVPVLRARVVATNVSARAVRLEHSGCSVMLEANRPGEADDRPVWRQALSASWPAGSPFGCPQPLAYRVLQPGESYDGGTGVARFEARVPAVQVYADSLPTGRYAFTAVLHANRDSVRIPAGEAVLPPSPFPLQPEYPLDGFHYSASSAPLAGRPGVYEVEVVVRNAGMRPDLTRYLRTDCPVVLHAYPGAGAQRTAPPAPVWEDPRECGPGVEPMRLTGEQRRVITRSVSAREVLGDSLPAGRYHFTAIVMLGEGPGASARTVWLDAGAVDLR